uniref:sphinganine-1-phosphate aldolase n=1 Tax=Phallusia mammillata TaxID=59560 RepID=A0A6F9DSD0_9ASCI|nr:sphingosine-1-phosphate lyase-like [Phallusia mammillata]
MAELDFTQWISYVVTSLVAVHLIDVLLKRGITGVLKSVANFLLLMPGADRAVKAFTRKEVDDYVSQAFNRKPGTAKNVISIPEKGIPVNDLRKELETFKSGDKHLSENGRLFAYVYTSEGPRFNLQREAFKMFTDLTLNSVNDERVEMIHAFLDAFMHDNALNPMVFPALRRFENEVVGMTASMLHGDGNVVGSVTSGGTESILMAMKTYRDRARSLNPNITKPTVVAPSSIHPAFEKAAHYFDLTMKHVQVDPETLTCDTKEYENMIDSNTILLLASAPAYPQAILDPIEAISDIALRHKLPFHVDGCFGGFMLPWVEKLGHNIPKWDFRVEGVTSISADLHKYGYATKGASVVCYRDSSIRKHQFFAYSGWSGGLFASPTMAGTRPGGHLAAAWIALRAMGQDGYMDMARKLMETANKMKAGIRNIEGLKVFGSPLMTAFGFGSNQAALSIFAISDIMEKKGWKMEVQRNPDSVHCTILPGHVKSADNWLVDLKDAVDFVKVRSLRV